MDILIAVVIVAIAAVLGLTPVALGADPRQRVEPPLQLELSTSGSPKSR